MRGERLAARSAASAGSPACRTRAAQVLVGDDELVGGHDARRPRARAPPARGRGSARALGRHRRPERGGHALERARQLRPARGRLGVGQPGDGQRPVGHRDRVDAESGCEAIGVERRRRAGAGHDRSDALGTPPPGGARGLPQLLAGDVVAGQELRERPAPALALALGRRPLLREALDGLGADAVDVVEDRARQAVQRPRLVTGRLAGGDEALPRQPRADAVGLLERVEAAALTHLAATEEHVDLARAGPRPPDGRRRRRSARAPARRRRAARARTAPRAGARTAGTSRPIAPMMASARSGSTGRRARRERRVAARARIVHHEATDVRPNAVCQRREKRGSCVIRSAHDPHGEDSEPPDRRAAARCIILAIACSGTTSSASTTCWWPLSCTC